MGWYQLSATIERWPESLLLEILTATSLYKLRILKRDISCRARCLMISRRRTGVNDHFCMISLRLVLWNSGRCITTVKSPGVARDSEILGITIGWIWTEDTRNVLTFWEKISCRASTWRTKRQRVSVIGYENKTRMEVTRIVAVVHSYSRR